MKQKPLAHPGRFLKREMAARDLSANRLARFGNSAQFSLAGQGALK